MLWNCSFPNSLKSFNHFVSLIKEYFQYNSPSCLSWLFVGQDSNTIKSFTCPRKSFFWLSGPPYQNRHSVSKVWWIIMMLLRPHCPLFILNSTSQKFWVKKNSYLLETTSNCSLSRRRQKWKNGIQKRDANSQYVFKLQSIFTKVFPFSGKLFLNS